MNLYLLMHKTTQRRNRKDAKCIIVIQKALRSILISEIAIYKSTEKTDIINVEIMT